MCVCVLLLLFCFTLSFSVYSRVLLFPRAAVSCAACTRVRVVVPVQGGCDAQELDFDGPVGSIVACPSALPVRLSRRQRNADDEKRRMTVARCSPRLTESERSNSTDQPGVLFPPCSLNGMLSNPRTPAFHWGVTTAWLPGAKEKLLDSPRGRPC